MIKREIIISYIILIALFLLCGTAYTSADSYDKYGVYVNGARLEQNIVVSRIDGIDYIPLNKMAVNLDITVKEDKANNAVYIITSAKTVKISNKNLAEINGGTKLELEIPIRLQDNNVYFPTLYLVDILGYRVEVMDDIKCIRVRTPSDKTIAGKLVDAELSKALPPNKAVSSSYPRTAYLTFDDGLDSKVTPIILDILKKEEVKATFFIVGNTIERNKALLKRMVDEGHSIGNHTYTHKKENIYTSTVGLINEIEKTNKELYSAAGIKTNLFRPPYGGTYINTKEQQAALSPYRTILWNVDSMDSRSKNISSTQILNNVIEQVKNKKSATIIMHDNSTHMETAKALPGIIKYLKENGFTILPIK